MLGACVFAMHFLYFTQQHLSCSPVFQHANGCRLQCLLFHSTGVPNTLAILQHATKIIKMSALHCVGIFHQKGGYVWMSGYLQDMPHRLSSMMCLASYTIDSLSVHICTSDACVSFSHNTTSSAGPRALAQPHL